MESLDLNTLANSLPTAHQNAEKELANNFRAAALSITTLYRSSRQTSKRAYNAGYSAACQDLLTMIQQGVSVGGLDPSGLGSGEGGGMTIGRVMDWTEARLEAIKSREEEEDEEEEREKERERGRPAATSKPDPGKQPTKATTASSTAKEQPISLPTPNSPPSTHTHLPSEPSSPSPPPPLSNTTMRPLQRHTKPRPSSKGDSSMLHPVSPPSTPAFGLGLLSDSGHVPPAANTPAPLFAEPNPTVIAAGAKRRHAMMMMLDSASAPTSISIGGGPSTPQSTPPVGVGGGGGLGPVGGVMGSRRRTRSSRSVYAHQQQQAQTQNRAFDGGQATAEAMDVEEDGGRERKRVARR